MFLTRVRQLDDENIICLDVKHYLHQPRQRNWLTLLQVVRFKLLQQKVALSKPLCEVRMYRAARIFSHRVPSRVLRATAATRATPIAPLELRNHFEPV